MAVTSTPTANKTSIDFSNFAGRGGSSISTSNQFLGIGKTAGNNIRMIDDIVELEGRVDELEFRVTNVAATTRVLGAQNRSFAESLAGIRNSVGQLQSGQQAIIDNAEDKEKILEKQRELEKQRLKRKGAEDNLEAPDGNKEAVEKNIGPLGKVAKDAKGILGILGDFFKFTIAGWFTDKSFKLIEAFQSGNDKDIKKIGIKLLAGAAGVAGLMAVATGMIGPILGGVFGLIGTLSALLLNPVTLTALLVAIGVGGSIYGIKKLYDWGSKKLAGGQSYKDAHKANRDALLAAGVKKGGQRGLGLTDTNILGQWKVKRDGEWKSMKYKNMTNEEKAAVDKFKAERTRIHDLKDAMNKELDGVWKTVPKTGTNSAKEYVFFGAKSTFKVHSEEDKKIIAQKQAAIRAKYENMLAKGESLNTSGNTGDGSNVSSSTNSSAANNLGALPSNDANFSVIPNFTENMNETEMMGFGSAVQPLSSGNSDNMYLLDAKVQYNVYV